MHVFALCRCSETAQLPGSAHCSSPAVKPGGRGLQVALVGTSVRKDVLELLEKRVRSRFSHQQLAVLEPCTSEATAMPPSDGPSPGGSDATQPWQRRSGGREVLAAGDAPLAVFAAMLRLPAAADAAATAAHADFARRFNAAAEAAVQDPGVADALAARHCWPSGAAQGVFGGVKSDLVTT